MTVTGPLGQVLRDQDRTARWFGRWTGEPASGSVQVVMVAEADDAQQTVSILACEPPTLLIVETDGPDGVWRPQVTLAEQDGRTTLRLVQRLIEPYDPSSIGPGWHFYLDRLTAVVQHREVPEDFDAYYPALQEEYAVPQWCAGPVSDAAASPASRGRTGAPIRRRSSPA